MNIYSTIYRCFNKLTNESYIGFDSNWPSRKTKHLYDYLNPNCINFNSHFYRALRKHGTQNFDWEIIYQSWDKKDCLNKMESFFIEEYDSFNHGYNMTKGGEGTLGKRSWLGKTHFEETKTKISKALKGKIRSEEHSQNISKALKGKPGRKWTDEQKKHMSEKQKEIKRKKLSADLA